MALFHPKHHKITIMSWSRYKPAELEGHVSKATITFDDKTSVDVLISAEDIHKLSDAGVYVAVAKG